MAIAAAGWVAGYRTGQLRLAGCVAGCVAGCLLCCLLLSSSCGRLTVGKRDSSNKAS